jgi:CRP-like cAMP-binding protein
MPMDALIAPLRRVELFDGLKPLQITEIARCAGRLVLKRGDVLTRAGRPGDAAFLIVSGEAERTSDLEPGELPEPIVAGSLIAEMAMLIEHTYGATIVAREPLRVLKIERVTLQEQMLADSALAEHFMRKIASRLTAVSQELRRLDQVLAHASTTAAELARWPAPTTDPASALRH